MNAEQEDHARDALAAAGIIGDKQDTAARHLAGMTEGWAPAATGDHSLPRVFLTAGGARVELTVTRESGTKSQDSRG